MSEQASTYFNYFITIHNKEHLIADVVMGVIRCMSSNSTLYTILDGCTDSSESIIDNLIKQHPSFKINKLFTEDVHELKTINAGLRSSNQTQKGYNIILQDDVILQDWDIENKITQLYEFDENLGIVSFRHGGNLSTKLLFKQNGGFPLKDYTENERGHNPNLISMLPLGSFTYREIVMKSPICIPTKVIQKIGLPDERFAPWDDLAYCYSVSEGGFNNGVYAIDFKSEVAWGTSRSKKQTISISAVHRKNLALFRELYADAVKTKKTRKIYSKKIYKFFERPSQTKISFIKYLKDFRDHIVSIAKYNYYLHLKK